MGNIITIKENEEFLRQVSTAVNFEDDDYISYINELKEYCKNNKVYALAPVQIGIPKRLIYIKNTSEDMKKNVDSNYDEGIVLINPIIISQKGHTRFLERCASCLDYVGTVDRPYEIEVEYYDLNNNKKTKTFKGFESTIFAHEYDHLNGILHMDRTNEVLILNYDDVKKYRDKHPYEIIQKDGEFICYKI